MERQAGQPTCLPGFHLTWIWYLGIVAVLLQTTANLLLLRREFARKLDGAAGAIASGRGGEIPLPRIEIETQRLALRQIPAAPFDKIPMMRGVC